MGWQPRPLGLCRKQRNGSLAGSCTTMVHPTGCLQAKQRQPGRDAPWQSSPKFSPIAKLHYSTFGPGLKGFQGVSTCFARDPFLQPIASLVKMAPTGQTDRLLSLHTCYGSWKASASCYNHTLFPVAALSFNSTWKMSNVGVRQP